MNVCLLSSYFSLLFQNSELCITHFDHPYCPCLFVSLLKRKINTQHVKLMLLIYSWKCGLPLECGWPIMRFILKEISLSLSQQLSVASRSSAKHVTLCSPPFSILGLSLTSAFLFVMIIEAESKHAICTLFKTEAVPSLCLWKLSFFLLGKSGIQSNARGETPRATRPWLNPGISISQRCTLSGSHHFHSLLLLPYHRCMSEKLNC